MNAPIGWNTPSWIVMESHELSWIPERNSQKEQDGIAMKEKNPRLQTEGREYNNKGTELTAP